MARLRSRQIKELGETGNALGPSNIGALHYAPAMQRELRGSGLNSSRELRIARRLTRHSQRYAHFDDRQIVDLTAIIANMSSLNRVVIIFQLGAPPSQVTDKI